MTTANITAANIETLRDEAAAAGDSLQVTLCARALEGDEDAWECCVDAIEDARAQCDD